MGKAKCCCGACSIEVAGVATFNAVCHCDNCRRRTGTAFGWSVYVGDDQLLSRAGPLQAWELPLEQPQTRWFCSLCGTTLMWKTVWRPGETGIAGGCFETLPPVPTASAADARRVGWVSFDARVRCVA